MSILHLLIKKASKKDLEKMINNLEKHSKEFLIHVISKNYNENKEYFSDQNLIDISYNAMRVLDNIINTIISYRDTEKGNGNANKKFHKAIESGKYKYIKRKCTDFSKLKINDENGINNFINNCNNYVNTEAALLKIKHRRNEETNFLTANNAHKLYIVSLNETNKRTEGILEINIESLLIDLREIAKTIK